MNKIIIIPDSFKGSASSLEVAECIERGVLKVLKDAVIKKIPIADGGEGTVESVIYAAGGEFIRVDVKNPLGKTVNAKYGLINKSQAVIEMAEASGITLVSEKERNPLKSSTYGTGELIRDAIKRGVKEILIGIGGSATTEVLLTIAVLEWLMLWGIDF